MSPPICTRVTETLLPLLAVLAPLLVLCALMALRTLDPLLELVGVAVDGGRTCLVCIELACCLTFSPI